MRLIIAILLLLSSPYTIAGEPSPRSLLDGYIKSQESRGDVFSQSREFDHFDYRAALKSATAEDRSGLVALLQYSGRSSLMGEGAQDHASILVALLNTWGDARFSTALQSCLPKAASSVQDFLDYGGATKEQFPLTFSVVGTR